MKVLIYSAAVVAALLTVLSTRLVMPALNRLYRAIEAGFAPTDEHAAAAPVAVTPMKSTPASKPRATRKRLTSTRTVAMAKVFNSICCGGVTSPAYLNQ